MLFSHQLIRVAIPDHRHQGCGAGKGAGESDKMGAL